MCKKATKAEVTRRFKAARKAEIVISIRLEEVQDLQAAGFTVKGLPNNVSMDKAELDKNRYNCVVSCKDAKPGTEAARCYGIVVNSYRVSNDRNCKNARRKERAGKSFFYTSAMREMGKIAESAEEALAAQFVVEA